jgi:HEAT repeat protein
MKSNIRVNCSLAAFGCWLILAGSVWAAENSLKDKIGELKSSDEAVRLKAIEQLGTQGESAAEAVEPLSALLADKSPAVRAQAAKALGEIGLPAKSAAAALVETLKDTDETVRREAVKALVEIRPGPAVMQPLFLKVMQDADPAVRMRIMHAISEGGEAVVPGLIKALGNEKAAYWACIALRDMGPAAKEAVPALTEALKSKQPDVRREAILVLGAIGDAALPAVPAIADALADEHTRTAATFVLGQLNKIPADAEKKIRENFKSEDKTLATVSLWALARVHSDDKELRREATERLVESLTDKDPFVRVAAARSLAALPPSPEITLPIIEKMLKEADAKTAQYALDALASIGPKAVPRLIELLGQKEIRVQVVYVLGQIGPGAAPAVDALAKLVDDSDEQLATEAVLSIGKIGPRAKEAVPALLASLDKDECPHAHAILYSLGRIGPNAKESKPLLEKALKSEDKSLVAVAAWALTKVLPGPASNATAISAWELCLKDKLPETRKAAAEGLAELGPAAQAAVPALKKALGDESKPVREAAAKALKAIGEAGAKKA